MFRQGAPRRADRSGPGWPGGCRCARAARARREPGRPFPRGPALQECRVRQIQYRDPQRIHGPDAGGAPAHSGDAARIEADHRGDEVMTTATFRIWRGDRDRGALQDYTTEVSEGMVVLDAMHKIQAEQAN